MNNRSDNTKMEKGKRGMPKVETNLVGEKMIIEIKLEDNLSKMIES